MSIERTDTPAAFRDEIRALFDPHIAKILAKVKEQLNWLTTNGNPSMVVSG
jgi:hypothetical protein